MNGLQASHRRHAKTQTIQKREGLYMMIDQLKINRSTDTMGISPDDLRFSFVADQSAEYSCSIATHTGDLVAQKTILLQEASGFSFDGLRLRPATRYEFRVSGGGSDASLPFETAVHFSAPVITPSSHITAPVLSRSFFVPAQLEQLRLAVTGLGLYRAFINGRRVGDTYLTPGFNDYGGYLRFDTYDVSAYVRPGEENRIEIHLGDGWYSGRIGIDKPTDSGDRVFGSDYLCALMLYIPDSGQVLLQSDEAFTAMSSNCLENSIYDGEVRDYRAAGKDQIPCRFARQSFHLVPFFGAHIREYKILNPTLYISPRGEQILDFGQNLVGFVRFTGTLPSGTRLRILHGEVLQDGCFYRDNLRTARAEAVYISDGSTRTYEPFFTYFGFRYALIEGMDHVDPKAFCGVAITSDVEAACSCRTDSPKINRLISNTVWGQRGNFLDVPTDCPQRDERLGWTADTQVFAATACYQTDAYSFYNKYLADLRYDQQTYYNGDFPMYSPSLRHEAGNGGAVWSDCGTILPYTLYTFYGDIRQLERHYPMMRDYADVLLKRDLSEGGRGLITDFFTFGDWLAQDGVCEQSLKGGTDNGYISSIYYCHSLDLVARAADALGYTEDHKRYSEAAKRVRTAILDEYFSPNGRLALDTQTSYVLALYFGIYRDRETVIRGFRERLRRDFYKMKTGFTGTPLLLPVLFDCGMDEDAYRILFSEECPGWLYAVNLGATTIWERWNSILPDGHISGTNMNSLNHYAYGSVCEAIYSRIAGLRPSAPGWRSACIEPHPNWRLKEIAFGYDSPSGRYEVGWNLNTQKNTFSLIATVPAGCRATLRLPDGSEEMLSAGRHERVISAPEALIHPFSLDTPNLDILNCPAAAEYVKKYLPRAYAFLTGENAEFLVENGRFLMALPMFGVSPEDGAAYEEALRKLTV